MPATFVHMYTHVYCPKPGAPIQSCVQWATCHPQVWFTELTPWLNPVGCSEQKPCERKYKWACLAAPAVQEDLVRARVLVSNAESLLVTSCPFQVKTFTDLEDIQ